LGEIGPDARAAVPALAAALKDENAAALKDENADVRKAAAVALGKIQGDDDLKGAHQN
jgi:HEAT repeat protein